MKRLRLVGKHLAGLLLGEDPVDTAVFLGLVVVGALAVVALLQAVAMAP